MSCVEERDRHKAGVTKLATAVIAISVLFANTPKAVADDDDDDGPAKPITELIVTARRLDAARTNIDPSLGASTYTLTGQMVDNRPGSESVSLNHILLQVPGVMQDGSGQLRVRQSHGDLQYRINNVILPEGVSDLGESISARIAQSVELVTGALPAQYGFQAGGVVNVTTKSGAYLNGGQIEVYGGRGRVEPAFEYGTNIGPTNLFFSGSFQKNDVGLASPDGSSHPLHDQSKQIDGFAYIDHILNDHTRVAVVFGLSDDRFQIPNLRGLNAATAPIGDAGFQRPLVANGISSFPSEARNDRRREATRYTVASVLWTADELTLQAAGFFRDSKSAERADSIGDLLFDGLSRSADQRDTAGGGQLEAVYTLSPTHMLRGGFVASWQRRRSIESALVLPVNGQGLQLSPVPAVLNGYEVQRVRKASVFAQDEWKVVPDVTLNFGLRFDDVDGARHDQKLSPRANAVWSLANGFTLHAGYARYFLPTPLEDDALSAAAFTGTTARTPTAFGAPLRPEADDYYDVGVEWKAEDLTLGVDAYWREARDFIAEGAFGLANLTQSFNYDRARIRGIEFRAAYAEGPLTAWSNLALSEGRGRTIVSNQYYFTAAELAALATSTRPLPQDQTLTGSAGVSYRWGAFRVIGDLIYGSGLPSTTPGGLPNNGHLPAYAQVNVAFRYTVDTFGNRPLDMRLDVLNVFDARYRLRDGSGLGDGLPTWGPRRGVFVGLEQSF